MQQDAQFARGVLAQAVRVVLSEFVSKVVGRRAVEVP